jgi:hypothetical protein
MDDKTSGVEAAVALDADNDEAFEADDAGEGEDSEDLPGRQKLARDR